MSRIHPENAAVAFAGGPSKTIPPLTLLSVLALRAMKSPVMMSDAAGKPLPCELDDLLLAVGIMKADPADLQPLIARATRDVHCVQLGIPISEPAKADMLEARLQLRELALAVTATVGVEAIEDLGRDLQAQIDHAFTTLVPMVDPEAAPSPLAAAPAQAV